MLSKIFSSQGTKEGEKEQWKVVRDSVLLLDKPPRSCLSTRPITHRPDKWVLACVRQKAGRSNCLFRDGEEVVEWTHRGRRGKEESQGWLFLTFRMVTYALHPRGRQQVRTWPTTLRASSPGLAAAYKALHQFHNLNISLCGFVCMVCVCICVWERDGGGWVTKMHDWG